MQLSERKRTSSRNSRIWNDVQDIKFKKQNLCECIYSQLLFMEESTIKKHKDVLICTKEIQGGYARNYRDGLLTRGGGERKA